MDKSGWYTIWFIIALCFYTGGAQLPEDIRREIQEHKETVDRIIDHVLRGPSRHQTYRRLANLTDSYGHRFTGSQTLEDAIDYLMAQMRDEGIDRVYSEDAEVPTWVRNNESLRMIHPRPQQMALLSLGNSVKTPPEGITAEAIVVSNWNELEERANEVPGKIVVYNQPWMGYGGSVRYRSRGATEASKLGAVAALVRSVTQASVYSPHTGNQNYRDNVTAIPVACINVEDAEMLARMEKRGNRLVLSLKLTAEDTGPKVSRNLVAEITGSKYPDEYVIFGGHIDSWDVGTGAMDDAGGVAISWQALSIMKQLGLRPKRTMRLVAWTAEETGLHGARIYFERHKHMAENVSWILESDSGTFLPYGVGFTGSGMARAIVEEVLGMTSEINTTTVGSRGSGPDIGRWVAIGVPGGSLLNYNSDYFIYHHTLGDTMTVEDPDELDLCSLVWTVATYVVANLENKLPRSGEYPTTPAPASGAQGLLPVGQMAAYSGVIVLIIHRLRRV